MKTNKLLWLTAILVIPTLVLATSPNTKLMNPASNSTIEEVKSVGSASYDASKPFVKPTDDELYKALPIESFAVTQRCGTETPFKNAYWDNEAEGIYVDIVSGEPLFSSTNKYDSGSGWPSFWKPIDSSAIYLVNTDGSVDFGFEVRSKKADSHLGHVFKDGPEPSGLRFCINSAALKFIPKADLEKLGYGEYLDLFK